MEKEFLENANLFYEYHKINEIKKANIHARKMNTILDKIVKEVKYKEFLDNILSCENDIAIIWACGTCIECNYMKQRALDILKSLSCSSDQIVARDAGMLLFVKTNMIEQ